MEEESNLGTEEWLEAPAELGLHCTLGTPGLPQTRSGMVERLQTHGTFLGFREQPSVKEERRTPEEIALNLRTLGGQD